MGEASQQLSGDLQGGQRQPLPAQPRGFPLGHPALPYAPSFSNHVQSRLHRSSWHPGQGPGPMWAPLCSQSSPKTGQSLQNGHANTQMHTNSHTMLEFNHSRQNRSKTQILNQQEASSNADFCYPLSGEYILLFQLSDVRLLFPSFFLLPFNKCKCLKVSFSCSPGSSLVLSLCLSLPDSG